MVFKTTVLAALLTVSVSAAAYNEAQFDAPVIDEGQISAMMNSLYELIMPEYKKVYKRHYDDIEWLEHFYVCNRQQGDAVIMALAQELQDVLVNQMDRFVDVMVDQMQIPVKPSKQERQTLSTVMSQLMPVMMVQGLQKNAELKSSIYQELYGDQI